MAFTHSLLLGFAFCDRSDFILTGRFALGSTFGSHQVGGEAGGSTSGWWVGLGAHGQCKGKQVLSARIQRSFCYVCVMDQDCDNTRVKRRYNRYRQVGTAELPTFSCPSNKQSFLVTWETNQPCIHSRLPGMIGRPDHSTPARAVNYPQDAEAHQARSSLP